MSRFHTAALGLAAACLLVPASASPQSLADVAAREKERRSGKAVKSYSEDDLQGGGGPVFETSLDEAAPAAGTPAEGESGEGAPQAEGSAPGEKSEEEQRAEQRKAWGEKLQKAQEDVDNTAAEIEKVQRGLGDLTGNYYSASRTAMLNRMEELTKKYAAAKETLDAVREEGRRNRF